MSENAQKRILIIMRRTGDRETDTRHIMSAYEIREALETRFPRTYNIGTVAGYLSHLWQRNMLATVPLRDLQFRLTDTGFDEASKLWDQRYELSYIESPVRHSLADATTGALATTREFITASS